MNNLTKIDTKNSPVLYLNTCVQCNNFCTGTYNMCDNCIVNYFKMELEIKNIEHYNIIVEKDSKIEELENKLNNINKIDLKDNKIFDELNEKIKKLELEANLKIESLKTENSRFLDEISKKDSMIEKLNIEIVDLNKLLNEKVCLEERKTEIVPTIKKEIKNLELNIKQLEEMNPKNKNIKRKIPNFGNSINLQTDKVSNEVLNFISVDLKPYQSCFEKGINNPSLSISKMDDK